MIARVLSIGATLIALYVAWVAAWAVLSPTDEPAAVPQDTSTVAPSSIAAAFLPVSEATSWPVPEAPTSDVSSTFGPRVRQSTGAYDFHRGIDIHASTGTPVVASYPGTLYGIRSFASGGLTVILEHRLPAPVTFHGESVDRFFTLHMHLSAVAASLQDAEDRGVTLEVPTGMEIGAVGMSGDTVSPHLHFEVRLGSQCSLEFQTNNPDSTCFGLGADPHIHPLLLFPPQQLDIGVHMLEPVTSTSPGVFEVTTSDSRTLIGSYALDIISDGQVVGHHMLDLNTRAGFDASTNDRLDRPDVTVPHLVPNAFTYDADEWSIQYVVPPDAATIAGSASSLRLTVTDVWGRSTSLTVDQ